MKFDRMLAGATAAVSTIALAGCGSSGSSALLDAIYAADAGTTAEALDSSETLTAYNKQMSSSARRTDGVWASNASPEFSIKKNDQGGVDVTLGGEIVSYAPADLSANGFGWEKEEDGNHRGVFTWSAPSANEALDGNASYPHHQVWAYFWGTEDGETFNGYAVVGTETKASALEGKANATYHGLSSAELYEKGSASFDRTRIQGDVELNADFSAGEISGTISNLMSQTRTGGVWDPETNVDGSVLMNTAGIDGNSFSGTLIGDNTPFEGFDGANYGGKFYGENGEEVGGVILVDNDDVVGSGFFTADQD